MNIPANRKALGRGIESLLPNRNAVPGATSVPPSTTVPTVATTTGDMVEFVALSQITPNPRQPRKHFEMNSLRELADSIREQGVLQPVLLRRMGSSYELIAGERRFRAAELAGLATLPAIVRNFNDERSLEVAIIENMQREGLNPMEQAHAFQDLALRFRLTQEEIATKTGKDRTSVANFMRLLKLTPDVQAMVETGSLSMGHARALVGLSDETQISLARHAINSNWSVRRIEDAVAALGIDSSPKPAPARDPNIKDAEEQLARSLGARVHIAANKKLAGKIEIQFGGLDDFQRLYERLLRSQ